MTTLTSVVHLKACALYLVQILNSEQQMIFHVGDRHNFSFSTNLRWAQQFEWMLEALHTIL